LLFPLPESLKITTYQRPRLADFTTFRLGGPCPALFVCSTPEQLKYLVTVCTREDTRFILIGQGSNLLVSDAGIDCYVIRYLSETPIIDRQGNDLIVSASTLLDHLAEYAASNGLEGLNCVTGIPGTIGGALVGNAGAFGRQIGDVVDTVDVLDRHGHSKTLTAHDFQFSYRHSKLKETSDIIVSVRLKLIRFDQDRLLKERAKILNIRRKKHPDLSIHPCAGSFFRNIEPTSKAGKRQAAGWFLEQAGVKSLTVGGAKIFEKHANIIVKGHDCTAQDVYDLAQKMADAAEERFQLDLVREVRLVGAFQKMPEDVRPTIW